MIDHSPRPATRDLSAKQATVALCAVLLAGFALRVWATLEAPLGPNTFSDDNAYLSSAATFAKTGYITYADPDELSAVLGPGMPLLLGLLLRVFGCERVGLLAAHIAFSCVGLVTGYGAYLWGKLLGNRKTGVIAAGLVTLDINMIAANSVFYTETPYTCLNLYALYFFVTCMKPWSARRYAAGAACLCAAAAFKGLALLAPACMLPLLFMERVPVKRWAPKALLLAAIFALAFAPWCTRNLRVIGQCAPFPVSQGDQKLLGTYEGFGCPEGDYDSDKVVLDKRAWDNGYERDKLRRLAERGALADERYAAWLRQSPVGFLATHLLYKPFKLLTGTFYPQKTLGVPEPVAKAGWWALLLLAALGALPQRGAKRRRETLVPLLYLLAAVYITSAYVPLGRYNLPHMPLLAPYAAMGLGRLRSLLSPSPP